MYIITDYKGTTSEIVGRKAYNLFVLNKHFSVPEFAVAVTRGFEDYQKNRKITAKLETELKETLEYFLRKGPVAIRSSGTAEDLPGVSFAGMYNTTLNVTDVADGIKAIIRTWDSIGSERAKVYREKNNITVGQMAVIIQHQLQPEVSGVMVTQSPFSVYEVLVECCLGLGERLVSGKIDPTRYRIRGKEIAEQKGESLLSKDQLFDLVAIGKKIERLYKAPQDIEWAIEKDKIYILQSRCILLNAAMPRRPCQVWSNVNVRETMPEPMSPMWWSLFDDTVFSIFVKNVFNFPINRSQYEKYRIVEMISGRLYWNVNNMLAYGKSIGPILDLLEGSRSMDPQLAMAIKAIDFRNLPKPMSGLKMSWFTIIAFTRLVYYLLLSFFRYGWMFSKITHSYDKFEEMNWNFVPSNDLNQGIENVKNWIKSMMWVFARRYFGGVFLSIFHLVLLGRLLRIRMGKQGEAIARKAMLGIIDKTGEMVLAVNNLAQVAKERTDEMTVKNLEDLHKNDKTFKKLFDQFLNDFGQRGPAEFDIASPNWREDHELVYRLIQTARDSHQYDFNRPRMTKELLKSLRPMERFILKIFLPRIEVFTPLRENGKHIYLKAAAKQKDQLFVIADILLAQGFVKQKRDIFFFSLHDLEKIVQNKLTKQEALKLIKIRKEQWKLYQRTPAPDIIYSSGERITTCPIFSKILSGESVSYGKVKGRARIIKDFKESDKLKQGEILVTHHTDPGWTPLFNVAAGVIIEVGGLICHAAMVARELGTPAIVIKGATKLIPNGKMVELDADVGKVFLI